MKKNEKMVKKNLRNHFGFLKKAVCSHLITYSYLFEMNWYEPNIIKAIADFKNFVFETKRGGKKKNGSYHKAEKALIRKRIFNVLHKKNVIIDFLFLCDSETHNYKDANKRNKRNTKKPFLYVFQNN